MKSAYLLRGALLTAAITLVTAPAQAEQTHDLYFAQAGAALTYSFAEVRVLYGAVTDRKAYDPRITEETIQELKRALGSAKLQTVRSAEYLPSKMKQHRAKLEKLRKAIVKCEETLGKLEMDVDEQTKSLVEDDEPSELGVPLDEGAEPEPPKKVDWRLLRNRTRWLAYDIKVARELYKQAAMKVARKVLRSPPRPRGRRP